MPSESFRIEFLIPFITARLSIQVPEDIVTRVVQQGGEAAIDALASKDVIGAFHRINEEGPIAVEVTKEIPNPCSIFQYVFSLIWRSTLKSNR